MPPIVTQQGVDVGDDYHSDTADSLHEVPTDKSVNIDPEGKENNKGEGEGRIKLKKRVKKKKLKEEDMQSEDELNCTTMFTLNENATFRADGSLDYTGVKHRPLPLTPTNLRKFPPIENDNEKSKDEINSDVPPLDLSHLRGSHESVSFQPYSATFRSTDTILTDRMLPTLKEEKHRSTLKTVHDTEV